MWPKTGVFDRTDGLGFGFRPELLGSVASIITNRRPTVNGSSNFEIH